VFEDLGHTVVVRSTPVISTLPELYRSGDFDQVWADLLHIPDDLGRFIRSLAKIVVGIGAESWKSAYPQKMEYCTHFLMLDPTDVTRVRSMGKPAMFWMPTISMAGVREYKEPVVSTAVFCGRLYGPRAKMLASNEEYVQYAEYEISNRPEYAALEYFLTSGNVARPAIGGLTRGYTVLDYLERRAREKSLEDSCDLMQRHVAVVNFPTVCGFFPDRVYRALAVGTPVLSCWYSEEMQGMFEPGEGVMYYRSHGQLQVHIMNLRDNPEFRRQVGEAGQRRLLKDYMLEFWVKHALEWADVN